MKRIMITVILLLGLGIIMTSSLASERVEEIPGGKNLLNLKTLCATEHDDYGYSDSHTIRVEIGETYTLVMDYDYAAYCIEDMVEFEFEYTTSGNPFVVSYQFDETNERVYAEFSPVEELINVFSVPVPKGLSMISYNIMLYEGNYASFEHFEPYLQNSFTRVESGELSIDFDYMMSIEDISALITAKNPDGTTIEKAIISDTFSSGDKSPGTYEITFQAQANLVKRQYVLDVHIFDQTPPVISGPDALEYEISDRPSVSEVNAQYSAIDNADGTVPVSVHTDTYTHASSLGVYWIYYEAIDSSGNTTRKEVPITLVDTTPPELHGPLDLYIYTTDIPYTSSEIIDTYEATDIVDGDCAVSISTNQYAETSIAGIYEVLLETSDMLGNIAIRTIYIHVIDNRGPEFETDELIIETTAQTVLSSDDVISEFRAHMATLSVKVEHIEVSYSEYEAHESEEGDYYVYLSYDVDGQTETSRVLVTVEKEGWEFSPYYLIGILPVGGIIGIIVMKKRLF